MEWTEESIALLRKLWEEGVPTAEIGRRLGTTKNAVVGKAHRLNLPDRPSPIRGGAKSERTRKPATPPPFYGYPPRPQPPTCCWPIGEPGTPDFHFCGAPVLKGKPYCAEHAEVAYVRVGRDKPPGEAAA
jgi:GcrA cell cycle regulator